MKQCPVCKRSYADDTLRFCLEDGTELNVVVDERTVARPGGDDPHRTEKFPAAVTNAVHNAVRVDIPPTGSTSPGIPTQPATRRSFVLPVLVAIVAVAGIVVIAGAGLLGVLYYTGSRGSNTVDSRSPTPVPSFSPADSPYEIALDPNDENQKLEDKIKELQKKIEEASKTGSDTEIPWDPDDLPNVGRKGKVNSPGDGFLALRNLPSTEIGSLIAKIPHGTTISVLLCSEQSVTIDSRTGHWCMVTYNNKTGWVFDAWLEFK
ncbi:MAG TPA: hypothetical protein VJ781_08325 [Pyrinomonadaceae bacterium]|nr:hypothetical protein [Pyrinomonadaceae bacterium]